MNDYHHTAALALSKCAAYDPWFPLPNRATVDAWAEAIGEYELNTSDVLEGVKLAYRDNGSGFRPLPHDIVQKARMVRRERRERESTAERQTAEDARDARLEARNRDRLAAMVNGVASQKEIPNA